MKTLCDALPPQDLETEAVVLGAMIRDKTCIATVLQIIEGGDFYARKHQHIFEGIRALFDANQGVDIVTLRNALDADGRLADAGGVLALMEIMEAAPSAANAESYARVVLDKASKRRLLSAYYTGAADIVTGIKTTADLLNDLDRECAEVSARTTIRDDGAIQETVAEVLSDVEMRGRGGHVGMGIETGIMELDTITGGFRRGEVAVIAARPSVGKTALALNIMAHAALAGNKCLFFSMEMSKAACAERMICALGGVNAGALRRGYLTTEALTNMATAAGRIMAAPIWIDDSSTLTPLDMKAKCRVQAHKFGVDLIIVDYLQLMEDTRKSENRTQEMTRISRCIKALARELNVPVLALSQLNRNAEAREGQEPRLSDLRESGAIEQDADVVILLHRQRLPKEDTSGDIMSAETKGIVAKNRNGKTGIADLYFKADFLRFTSMGTASYE